MNANQSVQPRNSSIPCFICLDFSMSLEIGNSAAVQLALIQIPVLVFFSAIVSPQYPFHDIIIFLISKRFFLNILY
jgi:Ca2+/H+ antiporter